MKSPVLTALALAMLAACVPETPPTPTVVERVDVSSAEVGADGPCCYNDGLATQSANGRYVLFNSLATNLVPGDTNAGLPMTLSGKDWFVRDRVAGTTTRVSVLPGGAEVPNFQNEYPRVTSAGMSPNGRWVVFGVHNFGESPSALYQFDRSTGVSTLLREILPTDPGPRSATVLEVADGGTVLAFTGGPNADRAIVLDTSLPAMVDVGPAVNSPPRLSADGRYVAADDYVFDRVTAASEPLVTGGGPADEAVVAISDDAGFVLFRTDRLGLTVDDTNTAEDLFVKRRSDGTFRLVTAGGAADGVEPSIGWTAQHVPVGAFTMNARYPLASISNDGRRVAFSTDADDVVTNDVDPGWDTFVRDLTTGATVRVTADHSFHARWGTWGGDVISGNGTRVLVAGIRSGVGGLWSHPVS